jgi:hypothetical protein
MANFHEDYQLSESVPPRERLTGLALAGAAGLIAAIWYRSQIVWLTAGTLALVLALLSLVAPALLKPLNLFWFRFSLLLHKVTNPIVMVLLYAVAIVPAGLIMQLLRDPLRARRDPSLTTYWTDKGEFHSMRDQF